MVLITLFIFVIIYILFVKISLSIKITNLSIKATLKIYPFTFDFTKKENKENKLNNKKTLSKLKLYLKKLIKNNKKHTVYKSVTKLLNKVHSTFKTDLNINAYFGLERCDITALLYGFILSIFPIINMKFFNFKKFRFTYMIYPDFQRIIFNLKVNYVLSGRGFQLISIIFILLKEILILRKNTNAKE